MLSPEKTREREMLLARLRESQERLAEHEAALWELDRRCEARLPLEEQFELLLTRAIELMSPEFAGLIKIKMKP